MDETEFWQIIERANGDAEALEQALTGRSREDLQAFDRIYREQLARAYRWELWGAGYVINGGMSDDAFDYFCDWLIGRGRTVFEQALEDPDSLADVPGIEDEDVENEELRYAVQKAHEATHGEELEITGPAHGGDPAGQEWDEDEVDALYPRLAAKLG